MVLNMRAGMALQWFLYYMFAHFTIRTYGLMEYIRHFDLLKAFGFIVGVVITPPKKIGKDLFYIIRAQHVLSYHLT